jgi:two-component system CheB/CheR fusion protein
MPAIIQDYVKGAKEKLAGPIEDDIEDEKMMVAITDLIKTTLPEDFSGYKKSTLLRRIKRRASLQNVDSLQNYLELLKKDNTELQNLAKDFLISVTSFFRDKAAFKVLEETVIPELINSIKNEEIKMWVAGCATGEEAYSLAILIYEQLEAGQKNLKVKIFATDIDDDALKIAGKGHYSDSISKNITPERLEKYFTKDPHKGYKIKPVIREILIFAHHDLIKNPPYCNMDFISCRNMLIYINPLLQKRIVSMLHFGLINSFR